MPSFTKTFTIPGKSSEAIFGAISSDIDRFLSKTPIGTVEVQRDEATRKVSFKSSMASGTLTAKEGSLSVDVSLSLLAGAFKGKIEEGITRWLDKTFPA